ncbi:MAG: hypothetical protein LBO77_03915 [Desulfovibrio sp.]|jgi:hypothetical protein|nr:hypothetical protein [Desulfovibrio sp.]
MKDFPPDYWIQEHALDESLWGVAYEDLNSREVSRLKLCTARLCALWGERPLSRSLTLRHAAGFTAKWEWETAAYALILCPAEQDQAERLLAACLPAILAGVDMVLPCFLTKGAGRPPAGRMLAALELAGIERAVLVSEKEALRGLALLRGLPGAGRLVFLGPASQAEPFILAAHRLSLPCLAPAGAEPCLALDEAHAGIWVWPDLSPEWFCRRRLSLAWCAEKDGTAGGGAP